ncbi:hypothetical protein BJ508DRAFT_360033 [Ascobolus immersus RN42]|uniref:Uncharacterized protein n=1 Tax=Ascobolus immersus RN42 TaxID=1160509 RepID=A0A3N4IH66_ASCIM|nr:hypothetical protein BJ508DRAFT_360033 [Ascobolus immersus RN42]
MYNFKGYERLSVFVSFNALALTSPTQPPQEKLRIFASFLHGQSVNLRNGRHGPQQPKTHQTTNSPNADCTRIQPNPTQPIKRRPPDHRQLRGAVYCHIVPLLAKNDDFLALFNTDRLPSTLVNFRITQEVDRYLKTCPAGPESKILRGLFKSSAVRGIHLFMVKFHLIGHILSFSCHNKQCAVSQELHMVELRTKLRRLDEAVEIRRREERQEIEEEKQWKAARFKKRIVTVPGRWLFTSRSPNIYKSVNRMGCGWIKQGQ